MKFVKFIALLSFFILMIVVSLTQPSQAKWPSERSAYKRVVHKEIRQANFGNEYRFIIETDTDYVEEFFYVTEEYRLDSCEPSVSVTKKKVYVKECPYPSCSIIDSISQYKAVNVYSRIRIGKPPIFWYKIGYYATTTNISYSRTEIKGFVRAKDFKDISAGSYFYAVPLDIIFPDTFYIAQETYLKLRPLENEESSIKLKPGDKFDLLGRDGQLDESMWLLIQTNGNIGWVKVNETNYDYERFCW